MITVITGSILVLLFTTVLTIAGVGSAFIIVPTFYWLGIPLKEAMAVALLLNAFSMTFASATYIRRKLVVFRTAIPIIVLAVIFSPLGAYSTRFFPEKMLLAIFIAFLVFAGSMMLFYRPKRRVSLESSKNELTSGIATGTFAGYLGGLLGVGGGNFIVPALVWLGFDPKKASGTTAFIVIFSSLSGFFGHAATSHVNLTLLSVSAIGSVAGGLIGSWLMTQKLQSNHVKTVIGIVLYAVAIKMAWGIIF
ncbi:MAG TPA: sulfite exporter TauE/SafE family protein [Thermodesulfobacteriota bacterium]|nr:sulfite exporter TauE/SafE family protein [Thermodesulfobacteriota bacterium]